MQTVKAKFDILGECATNIRDSLTEIELAGRVAYQSQKKITEDSAIRFCKMITKRGHHSVLEHSNLVVAQRGITKPLIDNILPVFQYDTFFDDKSQMPYHMIRQIGDVQYTGGNIRAWMDYLKDTEKPKPLALFTLIEDYLSPIYNSPVVQKNQSASEFQIVTEHSKIPKDMKRVMVRFTCPRGITHEICRHRRRIGITQSCVTGDTCIHHNGQTIKQLFDREKIPNGKAANKNINLRSVNSNGIIVANKIINIVCAGVDHVYEITTRFGRKIKATTNHKFQVSSGEYKRLGDLKVGDLVNCNGRPAFQLNLPNDKLRNLYLTKGLTPLEIANTIGVSNGNDTLYRGVIRGLKGLNIFVPRKNDKNPEKYNKNHTPDSYKKMSSSIRKGYENGRNPWNKGIFWKKNACLTQGGKRARMLKEKINSCEVCSAKGPFEVHHIDEDPLNNSPNNIIKVCRACHGKFHSKDFGINMIVYPDKITKISYTGKEKTYDLTMQGPNHNYIANGFVVHNSTRWIRYKSLKAHCPPGLTPYQYEVWRAAMNHTETAYSTLLETECKPEIARAVLPIATSAEIVVTADIEEWEWIFHMRCAPDAQPEMRALMIPLEKEFKAIGWI